jgi:hypothetical protein
MTRLAKAHSQTTAIDLQPHLSATTFKALAAAVVLSALLATPVFAQAAISEPAAFQAANPYLDVLNGGAPTPALKIANDPTALQAYVARELGTALPHHNHR